MSTTQSEGKKRPDAFYPRVGSQGGDPKSNEVAPHEDPTDDAEDVETDGQELGG